MAQIKPSEIMDTFAPLLTQSGGIREIEKTQYQQLYGIMKNYSNKLVSRCIYCKVLTQTNPDILEHFLKIGVWDLIHVWMKACKDNGSVSFLLILLKLLHILPMNIERLRENDCPKIVKKLCKHENKEVSHQSNLIIQKWTEIIKNSPVQNGTNAAIGSSVSKEKKRKSIDNGSSAVTGNDGSKKIKSNSSSVSAKANGSLSERGDGSLSRSNEGDTNQLLNDAEQYESFPRDEISNKLLNNNNNSKETKARPVTVKVKQGKFRLDLSASSQKTSEKVKKKTFDVVKTDGVKPVGTEMKKLPILSRSSLTTNGTIKSLSPLSNNNSNNKNSHVLKDSMGFMDALSVMPVVNKRRRKINKDCDNASTNKLTNSQEVKAELSDEAVSQSTLISIGDSNHDNSNSSQSNSVGGSSESISTSVNPIEPKQKQSNNKNSSTIDSPNKSPPRFSFYKDILEESKCEEVMEQSNSNVPNNAQTNSQNESSDNSVTPVELESTIKHTERNISQSNESEVVTLSNQNSPKSRNDITKVPKPILNYIKKGTKKNVRWPDDDNDLVQVEFFEIDENERINVSRQPQTDIKRFDMRHEGQLLMEAKKRCITYTAWKLIPIYLDPQNVIERGCNSSQRSIQAEAMKLTLECFYIHNQIPDSAREPDLEFVEATEPKIIPLEDENNHEKVNDYSGIIAIQSPSVSESNTPGAFDFGATNQNPPSSYNTANDNFGPMGPNNANFGAGPNQPVYSVPPAMPPNPNFMPPPPSMNFDPNAPNANMNQNSFYNNNYNNLNQPPAPGNQAPIFPPNSYQNDNYQPNLNYNSGPIPPNVNPTSIFNSNQQQPPPNYFNQGQGPPPPQTHQQPLPQQAPQSNEMFNPFWPENQNMPPQGANHFGPGPGGQFNPPQSNGPRFPGPRGNNKRGGRRHNDGVCRFFIKFGKCKFEQRCNFSHTIDKPRF